MTPTLSGEATPSGEATSTPQPTSLDATPSDATPTQGADVIPTQGSEAEGSSDGEGSASLAPDDPAGRNVEQLVAAVNELEGDASNGDAIYNGSAETGLGETVNCASCHVGGTNGPQLDGIWSRIESERLSQDSLSDDSAVHYAVESIVRPDAYVVQGYTSGTMPDDYGQALTVQDVADIIAFLSNH